VLTEKAKPLTGQKMAYGDMQVRILSAHQIGRGLSALVMPQALLLTLLTKPPWSTKQPASECTWDMQVNFTTLPEPTPKPPATRFM
jgi:hypothetical protein